MDQKLHGNGETVLHLDDAECITVSMGHLLKNMGYAVASFNCPRAALEYCKNKDNPVQLVITGLHMREMNGLHFAAAVIAIRPGIPIVLFSANGAECDAEELARCGVCEEVTKPSSLLQMCEAIRRWIPKG